MAETTFTPALDALSFRDLLDRVSDLVQSHQPNGQIQFLNESWLNRLGYTKAETCGRNILDFIHADGRDNYTNCVKRLLGNEDIGPVEILFATKDGGPLALKGRMSVQRDANTSIAIPIAIHGHFDGHFHGHFRDFATTKLDHSTPTRTQRLFESVLAILRANSSLNRTVFLELVTRNVAQALDVARVSVWLFDAAKKNIHCEFLFADGAPRDCAGFTLARNDHSAYFDAIEGGFSVRADDARNHIATRSFSANYLAPLQISSMLDAPIRHGNHHLGVLCCEHTGPIRHWSTDEEEFSLGVSALVWIFLENQFRLLGDRQLQEANQQLERVIDERTTTLAQTEQRLRYVLTSAPTVLYSCAPSGDFHSTYISPNVEAKLGYPVQSYFDDPNFWMDHIHPADAACVHGMYERAAKLGSGSFEYRYRFPDGQYRWLRDEFVMLCDESGKPLQIVGSCVNIDDRRCAQDAAQAAAHDIRRLIDTANAPIFGKDIHHHVNEWNHCAERCTGYTNSEVIGRELTDFVEPQFRDAVAKVLENALLGIETANFEFPIIAKDGRHLLLLLNASTRRDANGVITGMLGVGQDITERRQAERRSLRTQRLESIGTLASGVAHDINNALAPILLATGLFRRRHPESNDLIEIMESSARRGASMVQQLLTFAKGVDVHRVTVSSTKLLNELEQIVRSTFPKNISARFELSPNLPFILGDSTQLHQVLLNLCVNARDAMPRGGRMVIEAARHHVTESEARIHGDCLPGDYVRWRVIDTGFGIDQQVIDRIFEPFFSTKSPEQGTGLGLSTAMGIVRSHGGFMRVDSRPGEGSTFAAYIPVSSDPNEEQSQSEPTSTFHGKGQTILVVDDEAAVRAVFEHALIALGLRVRTAPDGYAALAILRDPSQSIASVITDLHMPGMDGLELTREIKRLHPDIRVILSSGRVDREDSVAFEKIGYISQLHKPFTVETLSNAIKAALQPV